MTSLRHMLRLFNSSITGSCCLAVMKEAERPRRERGDLGKRQRGDEETAAVEGSRGQARTACERVQWFTQEGGTGGLSLG
jgi:hypothetical protein